MHAPQYPNVGIFGKSTLLDWLNTYTFPMEASMADLAKARRVYGRCIRRTLAHGTTAAAYYGTIDVAATNLLADLCLALGQRALVGRVCMDRLGPDYYLDESPAAGAAASRACIDHLRRVDPGSAAAPPLVEPVLTPRFAPACTGEALRLLGELRRELGGADLAVQTHVSENAGEVALVRELFPDHASYAAVYDAFGLLGPRTVLAHAVHLSEEEARLVAARGAGVAHCPCSNSAIASGEARVRWLLDRGIPVGLGTDMSGGYSPSVLEAARLASLVSNHLAMPAPGSVGNHNNSKNSADNTTNNNNNNNHNNYNYNANDNNAGGSSPGTTHHHDDISPSERARARLGVEEVLYLATRGGAEVLGLQDRAGAFRVGLDWDAQLVCLGGVVDGDGDGAGADMEDRGNVDVFGWESWDERVAKWVYNGDDRNTRRVWVRGRLVHERK